MLNPKKSNQIAAANEAAVKEQFEKLGYAVEKLDRKSSKRPRPDFLVLDRSGSRQMLCEVKTILSAGYLPDRHANISMQDENLADTGKFTTEIDLTDINERLADAVRKRRELVKDDSSFADLSLLVAFFFDFFADFLHCLPRRMDENISGILTIKEDVARTKAFAKLSREEQRRRLRTGSMDDLPPSSKDFVLVRNKSALRVVPKDFQLRCITEGYDESV
jgi:hypothetical protein